jgi:hypothetical protein
MALSGTVAELAERLAAAGMPVKVLTHAGKQVGGRVRSPFH